MGDRNLRYSFIFLRKVNLPIIFCILILLFLSLASAPAFAAISNDKATRVQQADKQSVIQKAVKLQLPFLVN